MTDAQDDLAHRRHSGGAGHPSGGKQAILAALLIPLGFGLVAYFMPAIMLAVGNWSTFAAGVLAALFVAAFFGVFWLRARQQRARDASQVSEEREAAG